MLIASMRQARQYILQRCWLQPVSDGQVCGTMQCEGHNQHGTRWNVHRAGINSWERMLNKADWQDQLPGLGLPVRVFFDGKARGLRILHSKAGVYLPNTAKE